MKHRLKLLAIGILAAVTISVTGCGLMPTATVTQTSTVTSAAQATVTVTDNAGGDQLDFSSVVEKVRPSVVQVETDVGAGSGWVVDSSGIIVTNAHVISDASSVDKIKVITSDGTSYTATSVDMDVWSDLAIIRIDASNLTAATVGSSASLRVGQPVAAIGNALDLGISMTGGWISRLNATVTDESGLTHTDLIGTDAAVNPGNSGGPLVNTAGEVIGITSIKLIDAGNNTPAEGIGYAISIDYAMPIVQQLISQGYVTRAFLGVSGLTTVNSIVAAQNNLGTDSGVLIGSVSAGTPADQAGLKAGDVIVAVDGQDITTNSQLVQLIQSKAPGTQVDITIYRGTKKSTVTVTLGSTPPPTS